MMRRHRVRAAALACLLMSATGLRAELLPTATPGDARIRVVHYQPDQIYRLHGVAGYALRLEFADDEQFAAIDGGDLAALTYSAHAASVSIKPAAVPVDTNITVTTNRRRYYVHYSAIARAADAGLDPVMYVVRFIYPPVPEPKVAAGVLDAELRRAPTLRVRNTDYGYCGHPSLKPLSAFDDGVHTRVSFGARAEIPTLFVRTDDGSETLLNFTIEGDVLVIHRVARQFVVRRGRLVGCIVNRAYAGASERLPSGTVSPAVERATRVPTS